MSRTLFITGTDTGCGKTTVTAALARHLAKAGRAVACFKPVASGCEPSAEGLRNDDAIKLMQAASVSLPYECINPVALAPPIAPHLAAERAGISIEPDALARDILTVPADVRLVEGAGGWRVPLGQAVMTSDLARALGGEVVLVVGLRLGCINHALLTASAIEADGCTRIGWVANLIDPGMDGLAGNIETIAARLGPPLAHYDSVNGWVSAERLDSLLMGRRPLVGLS
jgi:dethiobiotin synthetase